MSPEEIKSFEDPLMGRVDGSAAKNAKKKKPAAKASDGSYLKWFAAAALVLAFATLGYVLYQAQQNITALSGTLSESQVQLASLNQELEASQEVIEELGQGLETSRSEITTQKREISRYQSLYRDVKNQQAEQGQELEAIAIRKADQAEVAALSERAAGIEGQVSEVDSRVRQIDTNVSDLREIATANSGGIEKNRADLEGVRSSAESNANEISGIKNTLARDHYTFELPKNGSVIKVFDVALSLKDTDFGKQRFHLEIVTGNQKIRKKGQHVNEPILFYVAGKEQPYELIVNRVDRKFVTGHLRVPKT